MHHIATLLYLAMGIFLQAVASLSPVVSNAQTQQEPISIRSRASVFLAGQHEYDFDEIRNNANLPFVPLSSVKENAGFSNDNYWLKFSLENPTSEAVNYYLETARPITDVVDLYLVDGNGSVQQ